MYPQDLIESVSWRELNKQYNEDVFNPVDGKTVRLADHIAALIEADSSIKYGITSVHLTGGRENILNSYPEDTEINGIKIGQFLRLLIS